LIEGWTTEPEEPCRYSPFGTGRGRAGADALTAAGWPAGSRLPMKQPVRLQARRDPGSRPPELISATIVLRAGKGDEITGHQVNGFGEQLLGSYPRWVGPTYLAGSYRSRVTPALLSGERRMTSDVANVTLKASTRDSGRTSRLPVGTTPGSRQRRIVPAVEFPELRRGSLIDRDELGHDSGVGQARQLMMSIETTGPRGRGYR
jgi:hypothetical protein